MKKQSIKKAIALSSMGLLPIVGTGFITIVLTCVSNINAVREIPESLLLLEDDGKTLVSFKENVTMREIVENRYNTLRVPDGVENISPYAFSFIFDGKANEVRSVIIPPSLKRVGDGAFYNCRGITSINFLDESILDGNLEYIGKESFKETGLESVLVIPHKVKEIGSFAFYNCENLEGSLIIPSSVNKVGNFAFAQCAYINNINLLAYDIIPDWLWESRSVFVNTGYLSEKSCSVDVKCGISLKQEWEDVLYTRQQLANGETSPYAFTLNQSIALDNEFFDIDKKKHILNGFKPDIDIPLESCDTIVIPNNVYEIKEGAFDGKITSGHIKLIFNGAISVVPKNAFKGCSAIHEIDFSDSRIVEIGESAFENCTNIDIPLIINDSIKKIGTNAFAGCNRLKALIFDTTECDSVIEPGAFQRCTSLSLIDIRKFGPNSNPTGWYKEGDEGDKTLPFDSICTTGVIFVNENDNFDTWEERFQKWGILNTGKEYPHIDSSNEEYDQYYWSINGDLNISLQREHFTTFEDGTRLLGFSDLGKEDLGRYVNIPTPYDVRQVEPNAFKDQIQYDVNDKKLWDLKLNDGIKVISKEAFSGCTGLRGQLVIPNTVQEIGDEGFFHCSHLSGKISLPYQMETLGDRAFANCSLVTNFSFQGPIKTIGDNVFDKSGIETISFLDSHIPEMGSNTFANMPNLITIDMSYWKFDDFIYTSFRGPNALFSNLLNVNGTILVCVDDEHDENVWKAKLKESFGLPNSWQCVKKEQ